MLTQISLLPQHRICYFTSLFFLPSMSKLYQTNAFLTVVLFLLCRAHGRWCVCVVNKAAVVRRVDFRRFVSCQGCHRVPGK
ncbi:hypothetical protein BCR43DRAFT_499309 [Syncephalastrum racemosum]|uniref:Uncharacterized protein n=1 Tax=Syncephalastrum racemosum TaxID=13706 RepID=A0A1X2H044_SYNRA|nr:hypothetical protein BCR43DRAFT_499309 [Syncephalastrum racemosum]